MAFKPNNAPGFPFQPNRGVVVVTAAETTTAQTLYTAGSNGSKIFGIILTSTDTAARDALVNVFNGTTVYQLGCVPVPATAGDADATPTSVNLLNPAYLAGLPVDNDGNPFLYLALGDTLTIGALATLTTAKQFAIYCVAVDF